MRVFFSEKLIPVFLGVSGVVLKDRLRSGVVI